MGGGRRGYYARAAFSPYVQIIGCSNSSLIGVSYTYYSARDVAVNSAEGGSSLGVWATEGSIAWAGGTGPKGQVVPGFDANYAAFGATAVWYPLCIQGGEYPNNKKAYDAFKTFATLLRKRTSAPLYLSARIGEQDSCGNARDQQSYVVSHAVSDGLALQAPDIPPASAPNPDGCHFDPIASSNVGLAAVGFLDG